MNKINKIFISCSSTQIDKDKDVIVDLKKVRRRCASSNETENRTFIKRSVGKNPILDLTQRHSNKTISTVDASLETTRPESHHASSKDQLGASSLSKYRTHSRIIFQPAQEYSNKIEKFINFTDLNSRKVAAPQSQQLFVSDMRMSPRIPRLFTNRRQMMEKKQATKQENIRRQANNMMPIFLQQGAQKISLKYGDDFFAFNETMRQTKQISEASIIKFSDTKDMNQMSYQSSQFNERMDSNVNLENNISKAFCKLNRMLQNYGQYQKYTAEEDNLVRKLQMQNSILTSQLKNLKEQQSYLRKERQFKRQGYAMELDQQNRQKIKLNKNLIERQKQINQVRQYIKIQTQSYTNQY